MTKTVVLLGLIFAMVVNPMQCMQNSESNEITRAFGVVSGFQRTDTIIRKMSIQL